MKISDLKIGSQLNIGVGIICLLIATLGAVAWHQTADIAQQAADLYEHPIATRIAMYDLKSDVLFIQRAMKDLCLAENDREIATILQDLEAYDVHAAKQFDTLRSRYLGPQADIENVYNAFVKWQPMREETVRLIREGKLKEAVARTKSGGAGFMQVEILLGGIQVIEDFTLAKITQLERFTADLKNGLHRQLLFMTSGILALAVLVIFVLGRNIRRPLAQFAVVADSFRAGRRDARCAYAARNEFGQVAASFNELADTIEGDLALNAQTAKLAGIMLGEDDARRFCHAILKGLLEHTGSQMGAVYLLNDEKTGFEPFESIGMDAAACRPFSALAPEGEFGAVLATRKLQHLAGIPEDTRFTFATVGGQFIPREIVTIPIVAGNEIVAVISLATVKSFGKNSLRLLDTILATLSARMDGVLAYRRALAVSRQLERQNRELATQQSELSAQAAELSAQNSELEMQKRQVDESNRLKTNFLSNMSHELRTPLNSVIALSGVLGRRLAGKVPEEEYSYLAVIERNGRQLLALINGILDLSRVEAGCETLEVGEFSVQDLVHDVVEVVEPQANQKNITLRSRAQGGLPAIRSDYEKCRHILQNLVANAVKFTEQGGVEISVSAAAGAIHIAVSDTGIGIAAEMLPKIFDEFRQADGSAARKYGGTGLGLAIAKKYAGLLDGRIAVESARGKGSTFTLSLPVEISGQASAGPVAAPAAAAPAGPAAAPDGKAKTILLVEDAEAIIIQMRDMLGGQDYHIVEARNGAEALDRIEEKMPDAMILDLMMPGVDGFEVLRRIRGQEKTSRLPVVILTAKYITKEDLAFLKHNHVYQLVQKGDISREQLLGLVARMMAPAAEAPPPPREKPAPARLSGMPVVLVVEDNPDNMLTIKALLAGKCKVFEAEDGLAGIALAKMHQPHLILMDIAMPGMNGVDALRELRKEKALRQVPVIAVSASAMKGDHENFMGIGFDGYISKPIDHHLFEEKIKEFLC